MAATIAWNQIGLNLMLRSVIGDATQAAPGVIAGQGNPGLVTQTASPSQSIILTEAGFVIPGASPATNGAVLWTPGASITKPLTTPNATNPRIDLVTAQVTDPGSSTTPVLADCVIETGTPAASPVAPALAAGALLIATIAVPSGTGSNITNAMITDNRLFTGQRGATLWIASRFALSNPQAGDTIYENITNTYWFYNGATWIPLPGVGPNLRKSCLITSSQGSITSPIATLTGSTLNFNLIAGRKYRVHASGPGIQSNVANDTYQVQILQDGIEIGRTRGMMPVANTYAAGWSISTEVTPGSPIASTFTLGVVRASGTGTLTTVAGPTDPIFFEVMDVGGV